MGPGGYPGGTAEPEFTAPTANREGGGSKSGSRRAGNQNRAHPSQQRLVWVTFQTKLESGRPGVRRSTRLLYIDEG